MIVLFFVYLFCTVGGLTLVKVGANNNAFSLSGNYFDLSLSYTTLIGLALYIGSFIMWMIIVQKYDLSYIQPIALGLSNILIIAASIFILGESIGLFQWLGIGCILGGVILMNIRIA